MKHARKAAFLLLGLLLLSSCVLTGTPPPIESAPVASPEPLPFEPFTLDEKYTRFYPETTLGLVPRGDYGALYPYIGGWTDSDWGTYFTYGLCTADGAIVCDPYYREITLYEYGGERVYALYKTTGQVDDWTSQKSAAYLAASDGRFVLEFEDIQDGGEGTLIVQKGGKWGSVDYQGNELLPCVYQHVMPFSDCLALVTEDFETGYRYVDKQNRTAVGPLPPLTESVVNSLQGAYNEPWRALTRLAFHEGRVRYYEGNRCGYLDKTGAVVIPAQYSYAPWNGSFQNGRVVVSGENLDWNALIDLHGNEIVPMREQSIISIGGDGVYELSDRAQQRQWYIDRDGNVIAEIEYIGASETYHYLGGGWFVQTIDDVTALRRDGTVYPVGDPLAIHWLGGDRFCAYYHRPDGSQIQKIIDSIGSVYFETGVDEWLEGSFGDYAQMYRKSDRYGIVDLDGTILLPPRYTSLLVAGDHYLAREGIYGGLLNPAGDWVIRVSLLDSLTD